MKRRIGIATPELPWPLSQGSRRFMYDSASLFQRHAAVEMFTREIGEQDDAIGHLSRSGFRLELDRGYRNRNLAARLRRRVSNEFAALRSGRPRELHYTSTPELRRRIVQRSEEAGFDWIVGIFWHTWPLLQAAPTGRRALLISDVEHVRARDEARVRGEAATSRQLQRLQRAELEAWRAVDHLLCISELDADRAREALRGVSDAPRVHVFPVAFQAGEPPGRSTRDGGRTRLLCFGHWEASFNRDGLLWFVEELWPGAGGGGRDCVLQIAGAGLDAGLRQKLERVPGVELLGWVDSLEDEIAAAQAVVIPLRFAGGLRYRLLEAVAARRPVLCSDVAAAGSAFAPGEHYCPVNDGAQLRLAVETLQSSRGSDTLSQMVQRASAQLDLAYGSDRASEDLGRLLQSMERRTS